MKVVIVLALIGAAFARDLTLGSKGTKVFEEHAIASPAIWRQYRKLSVRTNSTDVISRIFVNDLRPDKNGDVAIVEGGLGQKNLTLELKSPTILRGYDFQIEVYAVPEDEYMPEENTGSVKPPGHFITDSPIEIEDKTVTSTPKNVDIKEIADKDAADQFKDQSSTSKPPLGMEQPGQPKDHIETTPKDVSFTSQDSLDVPPSPAFIQA